MTRWFQCFFVAIMAAWVSRASGQGVAPPPVLPLVETLPIGPAVWWSADTLQAVAQTSVGGGWAAQDWRAPQLPERSRWLGFQSEGCKQLGRVLYAGRFAYRRTWEDGQQGTQAANVFDTNPFQWADAGTGRWEKDHVEASAFIGHKTTGPHGLGLHIHYKIGQGARNTDPRPFFRIREWELRPVWNWRYAEGRHIGLTLRWVNRVEDNEIGYFANDDPLLYRLRGYGTFDRSPVVRADRRLSGAIWGANAHWHVQRGGHSRTLGVGASLRRETAQEGVAILTDRGTYTRWQVGGDGQWQWQQHRHQWQLSTAVAYAEGAGTDPVFAAVNIQQTWAEGHIAARIHTPKKHWARLALHVQRQTLADIAAATRWQWVRLLPQIAWGGPAWAWGNWQIAPQCGIIRQQRLARSVTANPNNEVVRLWVLPLYHWLTDAATSAQLQLDITRQGKQGQAQTLRLCPAFSRTDAGQTATVLQASLLIGH